MKSIVYSQGFNRVEHRQILRVERSKLNRLLEQERRLIETLVDSVRQKLVVQPLSPEQAETIWAKIQNHEIVQTVARKINCLTDTYPQFTSQVAQSRARLQQAMTAILNALKWNRFEVVKAC